MQQNCQFIPTDLAVAELVTSLGMANKSYTAAVVG